MSEQLHKMFGKVWKSLENYWKCMEVAGTLSETPVITGQKSQALINLLIILTRKELASI